MFSSKLQQFAFRVSFTHSQSSVWQTLHVQFNVGLHLTLLHRLLVPLTAQNRIAVTISNPQDLGYDGSTCISNWFQTAFSIPEVSRHVFQQDVYRFEICLLKLLQHFVVFFCAQLKQHKDIMITGWHHVCVVQWHLVSAGAFSVMYDHILFYACKSPEQI